MAKWLEARVIENRHWTPVLYSLRVEAPRLPFVAGQFVKIALDVEGERVARPFSLVNAPADPILEFYGVIVPEGPLSPRLAALSPGDTLYLSANPSGFLVMAEVPDAETLWMIATGTGLAPFLSILRTEPPWQRFARVVLVHAVRHANELTYRSLLGALRQAHGDRFDLVSFVSREAAPGALAGRIPAAIEDGRLEAAAGTALTAQNSHVMLCGNPGMVKEATATLVARGMRKHRRRAPGHITVENFW